MQVMSPVLGVGIREGADPGRCAGLSYFVALRPGRIRRGV